MLIKRCHVSIIIQRKIYKSRLSNRTKPSTILLL